MGEHERLSKLIGDVYDAALDPARWLSVLQQIGNFVGGPAASLYWKDTARKTGAVLYSFGVDPSFTQSYFEKYLQLDPFTTSRFFFPVEQVISTRDIMRHEEFFNTAFYKEWAEPQGWVDFVSASLEKTSVTYAECGIFRHRRNGVTDDEARRKMQLLIPHIRRAAIVGNIIDLHKNEAASFAATLEGIAAAVIMADADGRIVHANACAVLMLGEHEVMRADHGRLAVFDAAAHEQLNSIFAKAAAGDVAVGAEGVVVPLTSPGGEAYVAHVLPLTSGARRRAGACYSAVAAVFIRKAELNARHPVEMIADRYKLTPAEMRMLMSIVTIGGASDVARTYGLSEATVKTHLQRIFRKTDTASQAELVKLIAGFVSPLADAETRRFDEVSHAGPIF